MAMLDPGDTRVADELGSADVPAHAPEFDEPAATSVRERVAGWLNEFRPSSVTGGAPALPLLLLAGLNVVDGFDVNASALLLPEIRDYFGVSITMLGTVQSITRFVTLALAIPMGFLTDRLNRLWLVSIGAILVGLSAIFTGFAWTFFVLVACRFTAGLGRVAAPSESALLADYYPPTARASVFAFNQIANRVGGFLGPLLAGTLASVFFWQAPFLVLSVPTVILAVVVLWKLKEPVRGEWDRRALGASEEAALTTEAAPSWTESWRIAKNVRSLRRLWFSLPFTLAAFQVGVQLMVLYYEEEFGLGPAARGAINAFDEPIAIAGIIIGGATANRFLRYRPGRASTYLGMISIVSALLSAVVALVPFLPLVITINYVRAFAFAAFLPTMQAITAMVIPPRVRGFAIASVTFFVAPGLLAGPFLFAIADRLGIQGGILMLVPLYLVGAFVMVTNGPHVEADMRAAQAAAMAAYASREAKDRGQAKLLVVRDLDVHYDSVQVLFNVDFDVEEGEIIALLGTNGAGKSTLLRAISGITPASNGAIFCDGEDITHLPPSAHAGRGIIQVPGGKGVFPTLTVAENLKLAAWLHRKDEEYVREATEAVLDRFPPLRKRISEAAGNLSGGEQQMLTLGQAFLSKPRLLMIDELSLGLAPAVVEQLLGIVRDIAASGTTIILVEQSVNVALTIAERAVFMEKGEIRFSGPAEALMARPDILHSVYLKGAGGGSIKARARRDPVGAQGSGFALEVTGVSKKFGGVSAVNSVDLHLEEGKILGLIGPNGAGKTTLFDLISGYVSVDEGRITLFGDDVTEAAPDERARLGLARSFQDARLFPSLTVTENVAVALERHLTSKSTIGAALHLPNVTKAERSIEKRIDRLIRLMNLDSFRDKFVRELSTGSRRIVDLACVMACDPRVLLLDEPSAGIAQREAEELGPLMHRIMWETGCSLVVIDHDMPLLTSVSDELVALDLGAVVTRGAPKTVLEHPHVVASYLGSSREVINRSGDLA